MLKFWVHEPAWEGAEREDSTFYFVTWERGYLQPLNEWRQFLHFSRWNWVTFNFVHIEAEYDKCMYPHICLEFVIFGLGLRLHHTVASEDELQAEKEKVDALWEEVEARSTAEEQLKELWKQLPEGIKADHLDKEFIKKIELTISEPEEGERKIVATSQALDMLGVK